VLATERETPEVNSITLAVPYWQSHHPGQHVDIRLTAEDGYQAERSYSIASAPGEHEQIMLTVERLANGEVSPYLVDEVRAGDRLEVRGPLGGYFVWNGEMDAPLLLIAGGSGIVPLMAILRARSRWQNAVPARLLYSVRSQERIIYREELQRLHEQNTGMEVIYTLTRERPEGWGGYGRRIDQEILREVAWSLEASPLIFICGPSAFVETVSLALVALGYQSERVKTERFGATGDA
jgi:ferredoxin-NADP reductase